MFYSATGELKKKDNYKLPNYCPKNNTNKSNKKTIEGFIPSLPNGTFKNLTTTENATITKNGTIGQNATIGKNVTIGDNASVGKNMNVGKNLNIGDNLSISKNASVGGNMAVVGSTTLVNTNITGILNGRLNVTTDTNSSSDNGVVFKAGGPNTSHTAWGATNDWYIRSGHADGKVILQDKGGNVGIGTKTPTTKLHIVTETSDDGKDNGVVFKAVDQILHIVLGVQKMIGTLDPDILMVKLFYKIKEVM